MKFVVVLFAVAAIVASQEPAQEAPANVAFDGPEQKPTTMVRDLPADVLRDFVGLCFASTLCRVFEVGQSWPLTPFCGTSECVLSPDGYLIERVKDCGLLPKPNPKCKIINEDAKNETFPDCCPVFKCEKGVELEFPTQQELQESLRSSTQQPSETTEPQQ